jgi:hypothetical protein
MPINKKSININDSSLFAELVKGSKHKREKVLKEILSETSNNDNKTKLETNGDLKDIPVPAPSSNGIQQHQCDGGEEVKPPLPPLPNDTHPVIKKVTELPMPPGVEVPTDVKTPSPPKDPNFMHNPIAGPSKKVKLSELPMPPTLVGTEDLSDDENDVMIARKVQKALAMARGNGTSIVNQNIQRAQRPRIINRRLVDDPENNNWGERCVDVFQIMAQIGEGRRHNF